MSVSLPSDDLSDSDVQNVRRNLIRWYSQHRRDLPWRGEGQTPYHVLVSEFMLQQTQVATVIPYFQQWIEQLPTLKDAAAAEESTVLRLWQGLGYYSRAKRLHATLKQIVHEHKAVVPRDVETLLTLPGIGRYTAGAIASIAYDEPAPIVDGNVVRVLVRLLGIRENVSAPATVRRLWAAAERLVDPQQPSEFNSGLMELGAMICTPRSPKCLLCPINTTCRARLGGFEEAVPVIKKSKPVPVERRVIWRVWDKEDRRLVEQRPPSGRWASLWQFPTRASDDSPVPVSSWEPAGIIRHKLTHRAYVFEVRDAVTSEPAPMPMMWAAAAELDALPMSKPQLAARRLPRAAAAENVA